MKKLLIVLAVFLAFAAILGAQTIAAKGGVYADFGMDLDNGTTGFDIGLSDLDFTAAIGDPKSQERVGNEDIYGEIIMKNLRVSTLDADASSAATDNNALTTPFNAGDWGYEAIALRWDTLSARLVFGDNFNIGIWGYKTGYESYSRKGGLDVNWGLLKNAYDYEIFDGAYGGSNVTGAQYNGWDTTNGSPNNRVYFKPHSFVASNYTANDGLSLNLSIPQALDVNVYVESWKHWSDTSRFSEIGGEELTEGDNAYGMTAMVSLTAVENLTVKALTKFDLGVPVTSASSSMPLAIAGLASYAIKIGEDISITPSVAFDGQLPEYSGFAGTPYTTISYDAFDWGLAGGLAVALKNTSINVNFGMGSDSQIDNDTVAGDTSYTRSSMSLSASLSFGLVDGLMIKGAFEYIDPTFSDTTGGVAVDLTTNPDETTGIAAELSYDIKVSEKGVLTPWAKFSMDNKTTQDTFAYYAKAGVSVKGVLENTKLYLEWASNDLSNIEVYSDGEVFGQLKIGTLITF